jgi:hypothetical protein
MRATGFLSPTPFACSALRRVPTGLPHTGCRQGINTSGPKERKPQRHAVDWVGFPTIFSRRVIISARGDFQG